MRCDNAVMRLYAVTDRAWLGGQTLAMKVEQALRGGVTCVQLREKQLDLDAAAFLKEAWVIKELCRSYNVPFFINDHVEIAIKCGADGIHVGQQDMDAARVRQRIGGGMMLGVSVQTAQQAVCAEQSGADCLGVGAVFSSSTKSDADAVSHQELQKICRAVSIPVVAIGGISKYNMMELKGSGIDGVALVSAIFASDNIETECKALRKLSEELVAG